MRNIFEEYGGPIIIVLVIVALIAIVGIIMATNGPVATQITQMIGGLFSKTGIPTPTP